MLNSKSINLGKKIILYARPELKRLSKEWDKDFTETCRKLVESGIDISTNGTNVTMEKWSITFTATIKALEIIKNSPINFDDHYVGL